MMVYRVLLQDEQGVSIPGEVQFYNDAGDMLGSAGVHIGGSDIYPDEVPDRTVHYRFVSPGYGYYGSSTFYDSNIVTLVKETPVLKYFLLGSLGAAIVYGLSRLLK